MKKVLVAGATGGLGKKVVRELKNRDYSVRALATNRQSLDGIREEVDEAVLADASNPSSLEKICDQMDFVFSALGKSVSLFSNNDKTFFEVDYQANKHILDQAKKSGIKRFVYVSIYGSDVYSDKFELAKVHRDLERELTRSDMSYTIIRPVGIFTGLLDVLRMAKNGVVLTVGEGKNKTNPIHEEDLAVFCVDHLKEGPNILEVGGPVVYTRDQIADLAIRAVGQAQHIHLPETVVDIGLPFMQLYDQNFFDKLAFFNNVLTHDVVAPQYGSRKLEDYFAQMHGSIKESWADLFY